MSNKPARLHFAEINSSACPENPLPLRGAGGGKACFQAEHGNEKNPITIDPRDVERSKSPFGKGGNVCNHLLQARCNDLSENEKYPPVSSVGKDQPKGRGRIGVSGQSP